MKIPFVRKLILTISFCILSVLIAFAHPSYGIVVDKHENIYFADLGHHGDGAVWKLSRDGKLTALFKDFHCHNIMLDKHHNLLAEVVVQTGKTYKEYLIRYGQNGKIDTMSRNSGYLSRSGNLYTYEPKGFVWKTDKDGSKARLSDHKLEWAQSLYVDDWENVYVPDKGVDNGILIRIDPNGKAAIIATDLIAKLDRPRDMHQDCMLGLTRGCDGNIYLAETAGQRIIRIMPDQKTEVFYVADGDWFPTGIDLFKGDAYILEYKTKNGNAGPRITKINESGHRTSVFNYDEYVGEISIPASEQKGSIGHFWIYGLIGIGLIGLLMGVRAIKYYHL